MDYDAGKEYVRSLINNVFTDETEEIVSGDDSEFEDHLSERTIK